MPSKREGVESDEEKEKGPLITVEEAKSGRSTCKSTGEKIEKGETRVGMEAYIGGRMTMGWQKLSAFVDNCRVEHCMRKGSGKCRATLHVFEKGEVRFVALMGRDKPHKMFLTLEAAREVLEPVFKAVPGKWDAITVQGLADIQAEPRKKFYSLFKVPANKAAAFDKAHPPPEPVDPDIKSPPRKRKAADPAAAKEGGGKKASRKKQKQRSEEEDEASEGDSDAEEV